MYPLKKNPTRKGYPQRTKAAHTTTGVRHILVSRPRIGVFTTILFFPTFPLQNLSEPFSLSLSFALPRFPRFLTFPLSPKFPHIREMSSLRETRSKTRSRSASISGDASGRGSRPSLIPRPPTSSNQAVGPSQGDRTPTQEVSPVPAALVSPSPQEGSPLDANIVASIAAHVKQNLLHRVATQVEKSLEELHTSVNSLEERISHLEKQNPDLPPQS